MLLRLLIMPENLDYWINSKSSYCVVRLFETMENHSKLK